MPTRQTRRRFLSTLSMASAAGLLRAPPVLAANGALETTTVRLAKTCVAPQHIVVELLSAEGFTDIRHVPLAPGVNVPDAIAEGALDFGLNFATVRSPASTAASR